MPAYGAPASALNVLKLIEDREPWHQAGATIFNTLPDLQYSVQVALVVRLQQAATLGCLPAAQLLTNCTLPDLPVLPKVLVHDPEEGTSSSSSAWRSEVDNKLDLILDRISVVTAPPAVQTSVVTPLAAPSTAAAPQQLRLGMAPQSASDDSSLLVVREPVVLARANLFQVWQEWHSGVNGGPALKFAGQNHKLFRPGDDKWHKSVISAMCDRKQLANFVDRHGGGAAGVKVISDTYYEGKRVPLRLLLQLIRSFKKNCSTLPALRPQ